jgi:hypothetical protein
VVFEGAISQLHAFKQLNLDVWIAGGICQGRQPIEPGNEAVFNRARLDLTRPANDAGQAEAYFIQRSNCPRTNPIFLCLID